MSKALLRSLFLSLLALGYAFAPPADEYPSLASKVFATHVPPHGASSAAARAEAALGFLGSLDDEQVLRCGLALDDPERGSWTNVPSGEKDGGVRLGDLEQGQLEHACDLLAAVTSPQGYRKLRDIMLADDLLLRGGKPRTGFGVEEFRLVLFGDPAADGLWALQLDGHHIGLNVALLGDRVTVSPSFLGAQPSSFDRDGERVVPLRGLVEPAFALIAALDDEQREQAILGGRRTDIASGPRTDGRVPEPTGLSCRGLDAQQRAILIRLLAEVAGDLPEPSAGRWLEELKAGIDGMVFAWRGPTDDPSDVSWRVQGPALLVEYACQDLGGDPLDHLHSMVRDPRNEYGAAFTKDR